MVDVVDNAGFTSFAEPAEPMIFPDSTYHFHRNLIGERRMLSIPPRRAEVPASRTKTGVEQP